VSDFIPAPKGHMPDEVVDPNLIAQDYQRLLALAGRTTQHQWASSAFASENVFKEGAPVRVREVSVPAHLYQAVYNPVNATVDGDDPVLRPHMDASNPFTVDLALYQIPYNRGLQPVSDVRLEWTTEYPELLYILADYQYVRERWNTWGYAGAAPVGPGTTEYYIRMKARIGVNGGFLPGTGPEVIPFNSRYRGSGDPRRSRRTNIAGIAQVPAGTHTVQLHVGQGPSEPDSTAAHELEQDLELAYNNEPPTQGVCLGHRRLIVISFPFGLPMGG